MGNNLNRAAEIIASALFCNDRVIDLACGEIIVTPKLGVCEPLVVTQVEVGLCPVVGHKDLTMLKRIHGARININVWVQLLKRYRQSSAFKECPNGRRGKPLA